ncbi:MAG: sel1 repeat family protein [Verrucomicrobia bacterium]|nr:sel1 repeat family protein [Verrucomicrobiota bacterium]
MKKLLPVATICFVLCGMAGVDAGDVKINIRFGSGPSRSAAYLPFYTGVPVFVPAYDVSGFGYAPFYITPAAVSASSSGSRNSWATSSADQEPGPREILSRFVANHPECIRRENDGAESNAPSEQLQASAAGDESGGESRPAASEPEAPSAWLQQTAAEYRLAAEHGVSDAQHNLGWMFQEGLGVSKDPVEAYKWLTLAGAIEERDRLARSLTVEQIVEGKQRAAAFIPVRPIVKR